MAAQRTNLFRFALLALTVVGVVSCETAPPVQEMSDARQAIAVAREAGAADLAAEQLAEAEQFLQSAERKLDQHAYREARSDALEAKQRALRALKMSEAGKDTGNH